MFTTDFVRAIWQVAVVLLILPWWKACWKGTHYLHCNVLLQRINELIQQTLLFDSSLWLCILCRTGCMVILLGFSLHLLAKEFLLFRQVLLDEAVLAHLLANLVKQGIQKYKNCLILTNVLNDDPPPIKISQMSKQKQ